jgi:glycosyltransferase involved in cell wall biosynthesis
VVGQDGWLFDPKDPADLAWALANLLHDPERRAELSRRGRERAARWTWEDAARTHLRVYREALR